MLRLLLYGTTSSMMRATTKNRKMLDDQLWILLAKRNSGEATPAELEELKALLEAASLNSQSLQVLDHLWHSRLKTLPGEVAHANGWDNIERKLLQEKKVFTLASSKKLGKWLAAASMLAAVAMIAFFMMSKPDTATERLNNVSTQQGSKTRLELPDGTQVWLNGNSRLVYNGKTFGVGTREVTLTGEAFFDVAANKQVPFIIHTSAIDIRVTGTAFNVKAYPLSKVVETALVHGSIEITTAKNPDRKIILKPNEKFVIALDSLQTTATSKSAQETAPFSSYSISKLRHEPGEGPVETVWMNNRLVFNEDRFDQLALKLEAWYNIRVYFTNEELKNKKFTGVIEKESLEETLKVLQLTAPFRFRIEENNLWLGGN